METGEESQEEPEASAENVEVSGAKPGGGKMSQTQLEQVKYILLFNRLFLVSSIYLPGGWIRGRSVIGVDRDGKTFTLRPWQVLTSANNFQFYVFKIHDTDLFLTVDFFLLEHSHYLEYYDKYKC